MKIQLQVCLSFGLSVILFSCSGGNSTADLVNEHNAKLEGRWKVTRIVDNGRVAPEEVVKDRYVFFKNGKLWPGKKEDGDKDTKNRNISFKLDPSTEPATFISMKTENGKEEKVLGIYKFEGNKFIMCMGEHPSASKPKEFKCEEGNNDHVLMEMVKE